MTLAPTARAASLTTLAVLLLAGCASTPAEEFANGAPVDAKAVAQVEPDVRKVKVVEMDSPLSIIVTPAEDDDARFGEELTVAITDIAVPAKGDCGYGEVTALAAETLTPGSTWFLRYNASSDADADKRVTKDGHHDGSLNSHGGGYEDVMVGAGMAYLLDGDAPREAQNEAKEAGRGLWGSCPDFGTLPEPTAAELKAAEERFAEAVKDEIGVTVTEVVDRQTFVVEPRPYDREYNHFAGEATVTLNPKAPLVTPSSGDCGYDDALAFARDYFAATPAAGTTAGHFTELEYFTAAVRAGFAYPTDGSDLDNPLADARSASAGLWGTCPGWGADAMASRY